MKILELTNIQLTKIFETHPEWVADNLPNWMVYNRPDWVADNRPDWMLVPDHILDIIT